MSLDTSKMEIVQTKDGFFRYVCHNGKLLTHGFGTPQGLQKNADIISDSIGATRSMSVRYDLEYGNLSPKKQRRITLHQVFDRFFKGTASLNEVESAMNELERAAVDEYLENKARESRPK